MAYLPLVRDLEGRRALITGAGRGIGRALALALARAGADVSIVARSADQIESVRAEAESLGVRAVGRTVDLADPGQAVAAVEWACQSLGDLDILVHAAGHQVVVPAVDFSLADWEKVMCVHLTAAFVLAQAFGRQARQGVASHGAPSRRDRSIIFLGSLTSERMATAGTVAYNAAKSGVLGLMRTLAVEWAADGIRVNAILPGFFRTEMTRVLEADPTGRQLVARAPMGRWGDPRELGALAVLLASAEAGFVTGATITVDGGWSVA